MSGRIRTIKPELLEDPKTASLSDKEFRIFVASILSADDYGNLRAHPGLVHGAVYWARLDESPKETAAALARLSEVGLIGPYVVRDQTYASITNWTKHQRVDHPGKARIPRPSEAIYENLATASRGSTETLAPDLRSPTSTTDHRPPTEPGGSAPGPKAPGDSRALESPSLQPTHEPIPTTPKPAPDATPQSALTLVPEPTAATPQSRERQVFEHYLAGWKRVIRGGRPPKLDDARRGKIRARLAEGYSVDDLKLAVDGLWRSTWHLEHRQTDLALVCRDAAHVDRFIAEAESDPARSTPARSLERPPPGPAVPPPPELLERVNRYAKPSAASLFEDLDAPPAAAATPGGHR